MLSQALDTRSDLTDLRARHPTLAERFIKLRDHLDQADDTPTLSGEVGATTGQEEHLIDNRHRLAAAFEATVAEIRSRDGFETFLRPPEPDQLVRHAQHGPVVVVNVPPQEPVTPTGDGGRYQLDTATAAPTSPDGLASRDGAPSRGCSSTRGHVAALPDRPHRGGANRRRGARHRRGGPSRRFSALRRHYRYPVCDAPWGSTRCVAATPSPTTAGSTRL